MFVKDLMKGCGSTGKSGAVNCGGFALGINEWWRPSDYGMNMYDMDEIKEYLEDAFYLEFVGIFTPAEAKAYYKKNVNNYLLYRTGPDDFHFMNVTYRGKVYHKRGGWTYEVQTIQAMQPFNEYWESFGRSQNIVYDSKILMMRWTGKRG